ncbi:hypothetical protein BH11PAT4_BH11PAT4_1650 [soil metagenome]
MQQPSLASVVFRNSWIIIVAIVASVGIFAYYGSQNVPKYAIASITIIPDKEIPSISSVSGEEVLNSAGYFSSVVRSWFVAPAFTKDVYASAGVTLSEGALAKSPITMQALQSPLAYQIQNRVYPESEAADTKLVNAAVSQLKQRVTDFNLSAERSLKFSIVADETIVVTRDASATLVRMVAPIFGLFLGIFVIIIRETTRRRTK